MSVMAKMALPIRTSLIFMAYIFISWDNGLIIILLFMHYIPDMVSCNVLAPGSFTIDWFESYSFIAA